MNLIYLGRKMHSMERYGFLPFALPLLGAVASAQEAYSLETESTRILGYFSDWFLPFILCLIALFLIFTAANRFLRKRYGILEFGATVTGGLLAIVLMVTGLAFLAAFGVLAWATATSDISFAWAEQWAVPIADVIQKAITPFLTMAFGPEKYLDYAPTTILAILLLGGTVLIFIGLFLILKLPKSPLYEIIKPGGATTFKEVMKRGQEPLAPTVTFKVIDRLTNQPSADVKVVLKHKEGAKVYTRYTDFNGEVIFQKIDGLYSQYYAYVEGDEERKRYWVIRTAIGAETVT
jgi:hypothetical protein